MPTVLQLIAGLLNPVPEPCRTWADSTTKIGETRGSYIVIRKLLIGCVVAALRAVC